jgi:2-polyprenyl-3-methyl-5-hydroxy-6-metoxy-1,4-benzoquinol methylase
MTNGSPSDTLRDVYERRAELEYPQPFPKPDPRTNSKFFRVFELVQPLLPCEALLDAGCGDGRYLEAIGSSATRLVGTDISERILETARATAARAGVEPELVRANLESLPFPDGSFDVVLCTQVIEHLLAPADGVRELARVLRPGGSLVITTDSSRNLVSRALNAPHDAAVSLLRLRGRRLKVHFPHATFSPDQFVRLIMDAGLRPEKVETFRFHLEWPFDRPAAQRVLNRLESALPRGHGLGDIVTVVARA